MKEKRGSLKWLWATLLIIGLVIFGFSSLFSLVFLPGSFREGYSFFFLMPIAITALLVWGLMHVLSKKEEISQSTNKKAYKSEKQPTHMKLQYLFYIVGVIFVFIATWYFAREYIKAFPNSIKLLLLIVSVVVSYVVAEFFRGADK